MLPHCCASQCKANNIESREGTMIRRIARGILLASITSMLPACGGLGTNPGYAIDVRRFESDEQRLEIRNITAVPIQILQGRRGAATTLTPNSTMIVRFRVQSLESHLRVAGESYYFRMAGPVTNHFQETDGMSFVQEMSSIPVLYFHDADGVGALSFGLNDCTETPPGTTWETMQWGPASYPIEVPPRIEDVALPLCPGR